MDLKNNIKRILEEENRLPVKVLRQINFAGLSDDMTKNSLRMAGETIILDDVIDKGAEYTAGDIIPWYNFEDYSDDEHNQWIDTLKDYLITNYGEDTKQYLKRILPQGSFNNDGNVYIFKKHSEKNGGRGFSDSFKTWGNLLIRYGWWFALEWDEIKSKLDNINEGSLLILTPGDKQNDTGYYFSIDKKKMGLQESIRKILKEEVEQYDQRILAFLKRRYQSEVKDFFEGHKFQTIAFHINDEWYTITTFMSKKDMVNKLLNMLNENDVIALNEYNPNVLDKDRQKVVKTIRYFLDQVLIK
jgi:hypothetical protein